MPDPPDHRLHPGAVCYGSCQRYSPELGLQRERVVAGTGRRRRL